MNKIVKKFKIIAAMTYTATSGCILAHARAPILAYMGECSKWAEWINISLHRNGSAHIFNGIKFDEKNHHGKLNSWCKPPWPTWPIHPFMLKWAHGCRARVHERRSILTVTVLLPCYEYCHNQPFMPINVNNQNQVLLGQFEMIEEFILDSNLILWYFPKTFGIQKDIFVRNF